MTLRNELEVLRLAYPVKRGARLRRKGEPANRSASAATLFAYLESRSRGEHHYALHQTVFAKRGKQSSKAWADYFAHRVFKGWNPGGTSVQRDGIFAGGILPSVNIRTGKTWTVRAIVGYALHDNTRIVGAAQSGGRGLKSLSRVGR